MGATVGTTGLRGTLRSSLLGVLCLSGSSEAVGPMVYSSEDRMALWVDSGSYQCKNDF